MIDNSYLYRKDTYEHHIILLGYRGTPGRHLDTAPSGHTSRDGVCNLQKPETDQRNRLVSIPIPNNGSAGTGGSIPVVRHKESWRIAIEKRIAAGEITPRPINIIPSANRREFVRPVWTKEEIEQLRKGKRLSAA